uniref:Deoxynucleoside kinase n=1 Tax=Candidatus Nitrotoga fabula TaxID=2182327 RepID=A0A2X0QTF4_9PROT|nr:protein of unknown function [Candidatus Nitrotoga fabula]
MKKILFLLAGYSGAGKSTLLLNALNKNLPVFGEEYNEIFQTTTIPAKFPDWMLSAQERLNQGSWFNEDHVSFLANVDPLPNHIVLHFDLIQILHERYFIQSCSDELAALLPRTFNSFANSAHNEMFFRHIVSNPFFGKFDRIIVNTLYTPWETNARQWKKRQSTMIIKERGLRPLLFDFQQPRTDIHQSIYGSWLNSIEKLDPYLSLVSESKDKRLFIKEQSAFMANA